MDDTPYINHILKQKIDNYKKILEKTHINNIALTFLNKYPIKNLTLPIKSKTIEIPINIDNNNLPSETNLISAIYWKLNNFPHIERTDLPSDTQPPINIIINTHQIAERRYYYFNLVQPYQHLDKLFDDETIGMYSFALHPMDNLNCSGVGKISKLIMEFGIGLNDTIKLSESNASIDLTIQYYYKPEAYLNFLIKKRKYQMNITDFNNFMHCLKTCKQKTLQANIFNKIDKYLIVMICDYLF
jgi:hypothetical protein